MSNTNYTKMTSAQLAEEIAKQREKIKKITETIGLLKKLKIAEDVLEKEKNSKIEKTQNEQNKKAETNTPKTTAEQTVKQQKYQNQQSQKSQQQKTNAGGILNGFTRKVHA